MTVKLVLSGIYFAAWLTPAAALAQSYDHAEIVLFQTMRRQPNDWARFMYLASAVPRLSESDQMFGKQLLASAESELGLYDHAILGFPLKSQALPELTFPAASEWEATDAADAITKLSEGHRLVLINEAHHNANTRVLTLALLPRLRALGFNYFAAEALTDDDPELARRGYPVEKSGTEYLHEPLYGDMVREAIRLGFVIVPYESDDLGEARDAGQASNLYRRVFAKDPEARLFVHCGYAHIDKSKSRLGDIEPMAMRLQKLTGLEALSIDQTQFLEVLTDKTDAYHRLTDSFHPKQPTILINRTNGKPWSADPKLYDVNVILPPSVSLASFGNNNPDKHTGDVSHLSHNMMNSRDIHRPDWLSLSGERFAVPISSDLCRQRLPCAVEARYADESNDSIAADRYVFFEPSTQSKLYLRRGQYRLRVMDGDSRILSEQTVLAAKQ
jgi:hypothetical protein